jgi:hypothetical protein
VAIVSLLKEKTDSEAINTSPKNLVLYVSCIVASDATSKTDSRSDAIYALGYSPEDDCSLKGGENTGGQLLLVIENSAMKRRSHNTCAKFANI